MKFNFWQVLGFVLILIGAIGIFVYKTEKETAKTTDGNVSPPTTAPAITVSP
ncbi:MAG: hypothetical protein H7144_02175 [Burkholderiales bacterium]|nr:hypothetical protein [Phycisphaerae bacterium]